MHWYWIDRFLEFESGCYAKAVKNVSLAEEHLHDHFPGYPLMPRSLVIEGLAQTGGLLICEHSHFSKRIILAKIPKVRFFCETVPGDRLVYTATVEYIQEDGAMVTATSYKADRLHAETEIVFAQLDGEFQGTSLFEPAVFVNMMRVLGGFKVGARKPPEVLAHVGHEPPSGGLLTDSPPHFDTASALQGKRSSRREKKRPPLRAR